MKALSMPLIAVLFGIVFEAATTGPPLSHMKTNLINSERKTYFDHVESHRLVV